MASALPYWRLSGFYLFYFALLGATAPYLALYLDYLGFSSARIGELLAIPMLMRCVSPNLWGWLGDRSGKRLAIVRFGACCTLFSFVLILFGKSYAWLALIMALYAFFWHAVLPQFEVLTLAHLGEQTARYSEVRLWGSVGFILTVVGLGLLFERVSLDAFPWVLIGIISCIFISSWWVPNAQLSAARDNPLSGGFLRQLRQPGVLAFFVVVGLMQLCHGPYYTFITLYLESLGYARGVIGQLWAIGVVAEILVFLLMARLLRHVSLRQVLIASLLLAVLRWILLGTLAEHGFWLLLAQLLHAATFGSFHAVCVLVVRGSFNARQQGQGQALYAAVSGVGGGLGALYAGYSWTGLGPTWTFLLASLVALLGAFIIYRHMPDLQPD
ncbi:MFS transporter [Pseudomonas sp. N040]|uniref:MFS transporter n=1 Tax=Pseudomonas sp. N040 TaxID=2785325 RepID=UPI0018A28E5E|nr:MFS transporter [Pseudomonas sp. N040]MBF7731414.1 MFS transporter [Pseudomonas sp. N040]MBW7015058.1 MFS transporter [Pseudomonas sp. N040]